MRMNRKLTWLFGIVFFLLPRVASAQCNSVANTLADGRIVGPFTVDSTGDVEIFVDVTAGHSYSFEVLQTTAESVPTLNIGLDPCPTGNPTGARDTTAIDPVLNFSGARLSWTADTDSDDFVVSTASPFLTTFTVSVSDTTQYNPRWSTFSGFTTQWGFQNTTNFNITGTLKVFTTAGTLVSNTTFDIPSGRVVFKTSSALTITANQSGNAIFTHNGPPGGIQADAYFVSSDVKTVVPAKFEGVREASH